jgi:hypothetical protein
MALISDRKSRRILTTNTIKGCMNIMRRFDEAYEKIRVQHGELSTTLSWPILKEVLYDMYELGYTDGYDAGDDDGFWRGRDDEYYR